MRPQRPCRFRAGWPPFETPLGQALGGQPEPLAIVLQDSDGRATPRPEDKKVTGKWVRVQLFPAKLGEGVDALSSINRLDRNQNSYLGSDLNHPSISRQARSRLTQSGGPDAFHWMRILRPLGHSKSTAYSANGSTCGAVSSTNVGLLALRRRAGTPPSRLFSPM